MIGRCDLLEPGDTLAESLLKVSLLKVSLLGPDTEMSNKSQLDLVKILVPSATLRPDAGSMVCTTTQVHEPHLPRSRLSLLLRRTTASRTP